MKTISIAKLKLNYSTEIEGFKKGHEEWCKYFLIKDREKEDFKERQYQLLAAFLPSPFLIHEDILNEKDINRAIKFIKNRKILKDFVKKRSESLHYWGSKLALLNQLFPLQCNNLKFNQLEHLNNYLNMYQDELSKKAILDFLEFTTLIQCCYDDYLKFLETGPMDAQEKKILYRLLALVDKGKWISPATNENIKEMLKTCLLREAQYTDSDKDSCDKFWKLLKVGKGDRVSVVFMNLIGYFWKLGYLKGNGPDLKEMFFGDQKVNYTNIDKGVPGNPGLSEGFGEIIQFLEKHLPK